jgi:hypothetical protein
LSVSCRKKIFFFSIFLFAAGTAYAQQSGQVIEFFEKNDILQRISWPPEDDVLKYELVIEKKDENGPADSFIRVVDISTEETSVEFSLAAGEYRYRVLVYDLLRRLRPMPEWSRLKVLEALQPEISAVNPPSIDVNDDISNITLNFEGNNLTENAEVSFLHVGGGAKTPGEAVSAGKDNYLPSKDGKSARLKLNGIPLAEGTYDIVIKNPGGLSTAWRNFTVTNGTDPPMLKARKPPLFEMMVSAGYAALFPISGSFNELFGNSIFPAGLTARLGGKTYEKRPGALGLEAAVYWHYMDAAKDAPLESGYFLCAMLDLLYQKKIINQKVALNARLGGGFSFFYGIKSNENVSSGRITGNDTIVPALVFSLSCSWFFHKYTFLDFAAEYIAVFPYGETLLSYVRPSVSIGFQF